MFTLLNLFVLAMLFLFQELLGVDLTDPVIIGTVGGVIFIALGYVFQKARWILKPLGELLKTWANFQKKESEGGRKITEQEKADLYENHIKPLLSTIWSRLVRSSIVARLLGVKQKE